MPNAWPIEDPRKPWLPLRHHPDSSSVPWTSPVSDSPRKGVAWQPPSEIIRWKFSPEHHVFPPSSWGFQESRVQHRTSGPQVPPLRTCLFTSSGATFASTLACHITCSLLGWDWSWTPNQSFLFSLFSFTFLGKQELPYIVLAEGLPRSETWRCSPGCV